MFALITNPENKNGCSAQGYSFCGTHWAYVVTLFAMRIKPIKTITSLQIYIKPTKPTISTSKAYQEVYRIFQDHQKAAAHLAA